MKDEYSVFVFVLQKTIVHQGNNKNNDIYAIIHLSSPQVSKIQYKSEISDTITVRFPT